MPFLSPGDLPDPGIEPGSPALHADVLPCEPPGKPPVVRSVILYFLQKLLYGRQFVNMLSKIFNVHTHCSIHSTSRNFSKNSYLMFSIKALFILFFFKKKKKTSN